ncbi:MAG TPA: NAD(P)/FAD-dependent oxidoreductase, partial [Burkholderiaceae bacterium]|nr:NAD(P)/FAD-dependent oxidoreductase [Burkholderiaceae bacterium]
MESGVKRVSGRSILADRVVAVVGAGPAGLMAAETIAGAGIPVEVFDAMPSVGRKFLLAGRGGLNLTHSEPLAAFVARYGARRERIAPMLDVFGPQALRDWALSLGIETFVGSSGRVFPKEMKAAPLLRHWLHRLRAGVSFAMRHRWTGWLGPPEPPPAAMPELRFETPGGMRIVHPLAVVFALGGASWARLGSDGAWVGPLREIRVPVAPLRPANCGF